MNYLNSIIADPSQSFSSGGQYEQSAVFQAQMGRMFLAHACTPDCLPSLPMQSRAQVQVQNP
jgi:hypothetical protein